MPYQLNGTNMNLAPFKQSWEDVVTGRDHTGRPIFGATKHALLEFDNCAVTLYQQFSALNGASLTSVQLLNIDGASFTTYSNNNIYLEVTQRPAFEQGISGQFTIAIRGLQP
jgi:hypothetical protein